MEINLYPQLQKNLVDVGGREYSSTKEHATDACQFDNIDDASIAEVGRHLDFMEIEDQQLTPNSASLFHDWKIQSSRWQIGLLGYTRDFMAI